MIGFDNINVDLIYALPNETLKELEEDIDEFLKLNVSHISCYSLMIEPNTLLNINNTKTIDEDLDYEMYKYIEKRLLNREYIHYEISNYCKKDMESKHNLVYWNNDYYYGFGLSSSGYKENFRYDNVKSINEYNKGNYNKETYKVSDEDKHKYEFMLCFRKIKGINKKKFKEKYKKDIYDIKNIDKLLKDSMLKENDDYIYIPEEWIYKSNEILVKLI